MFNIEKFIISDIKSLHWYESIFSGIPSSVMNIDNLLATVIASWFLIGIAYEYIVRSLCMVKMNLF